MSRGPRLILTLFPVILVAYLYCGWKLYHAIIQNFWFPPGQVKLYLVGAIAYLNLHPVLLLIFSVTGLHKIASFAVRGHKLWDIPFGYPFWFGVILVVEMLPWLLAIDLIKLPFFPFYKSFKASWLQIQFRVILALFVLIGLYVFFKAIIDTTRIRRSETMLSYPNLPISWDGLKIVHISDMQADSRAGKRKLKRYVKKVNRLQPDIVFFTGDLVTASKYIDLGARMLGSIRSKYGTYACLGDHDIWSDEKEIKQSLKYHGVTMLEDSNQFIRVGNDSLMATFVTNTYDRRPPLDKLNMLMGQQPRGVLDILLTHQPTESLIELAAERGYHIVLAGHTHGGQILFRFFGLTIAAPRMESPYYKGMSHIEQMMLSINNGLGFTFAPIRYNASAEITLIKIVRQPG
ncbi:metallophosphoesterase [candidate division KSB1 bacterium]|nr:metallophosphoesterase [candidate division KSB1 bacterium]NIR71963.1 metallophosphoesterase [candidate division KSB1 bacterium]NIS24961.1 metallophosphoesterase [candidate division KSB1 bacterium]NIT71881.1 metallophosphoesterase [candidate division KSB1 bacterium]NIU25612.1 metallophosphoesterase [candidate division KSB1 bacterium]